MASNDSARSLDFTFHSLTLPVTKTGSYGFQLEGNAPVIVSSVTKGSSAENAGLKVSDFVISLNGNDNQASSQEEVLTIIKYSYGAALALRVGRPHPPPTTDFEKRRAIITLQTKLWSGDFVTAGDEAQVYRSTLNNALSEVDDILGGFGLPDQRVPDTDGTIQEVELKMYDSDSLSSPPTSSEGSQADPSEDPLLDFSREDEFVHRSGAEPTGVGLAQSVRETQRAMQGMSQIMRDVTEAKQRKKVASEMARAKAKVRTEGSYSPNYDPVHVDHSSTRTSVKESQKDVRNGTGSPEEVTELEQVQWVESPLTNNERGMAGGHVTTKSTLDQPKKGEQKVKEKSKSPPFVQPKRNLNPKGNFPPPIPVSSVPDNNVAEKRDQGKKDTYSLEPTVPKEKVPREKVPREKVPREKIPREKVPREKVPREKIPKEKVPREKVPKSRSERTDSKSRDLRSPTQTSKERSFPFRVKKTGSETLPSVEQVGYVKDNAKERQSFEPTSVETKGVSSLATSCYGLPGDVHDWKKEDVGKWMRQMSMSLYAHYFPLFSKHDITGRSLLRLDGTKLKKMGITNAVHCRVLATEIAKLKIQQELSELEALEEATISYV